MAALCDKLAEMYERGLSIAQISARTGINRSRVRAEIIKAGVALRSRADGVRLRDDIGASRRGVKRPPFSQEWKDNIRAGRGAWGEENAKGTSKKASGYVVITRGEHKGRGQHDIIIERRIGRGLLADEVVHHIDRDRSNNAPDNLALVTRAGHARLHRFEDDLQGTERKRVNGRFC